MSTSSIHFHHGSCHAQGSRAGVAAGLRAALALLRTWRARHRQRRDLAELTPEQLRDVGISAWEARVEAGKPFWRT